MFRTKGSFHLGFQTLSLVVGFMAWSIISPLMPFMSQDIKVSDVQIS
ncbi:MFS transporter, partial [Staphylococcus epidermidis]